MGTTTHRNVLLGLSGAFGAFMASLCDVVQKEEASAVLKVTQALDVHLGLPMKAVFTFVLFVICGVLLVYVFKATSNKIAFYTGAGVIAMFMTATPYSSPPSNSAEAPNPPNDTITGHQSIIPRAFADTTARRKSEEDSATVVLNFVLPKEARSKKPLETIVTVQDVRTGQRIWSGKFIGLDATLTLPPRKLQLAIQSSGYSIQTKVINLRPGERQEIDFKLSPTWQPDFLQRLLRPGG